MVRADANLWTKEDYWQGLAHQSTSSLMGQQHQGTGAELASARETSLFPDHVNIALENSTHHPGMDLTHAVRYGSDVAIRHAQAKHASRMGWVFEEEPLNGWMWGEWPTY